MVLSFLFKVGSRYRPNLRRNVCIAPRSTAILAALTALNCGNVRAQPRWLRFSGTTLASWPVRNCDHFSISAVRRRNGSPRL